VGIGGEEGHLSLGVPAIRAVGVGLGKLADGEAVGSFFGGDGDVLAHADFSGVVVAGVASRMARVSTKASIPNTPYSRPTPEYLEAAPRRLGIVRHAVDHDPPGPQLRGHVARA
jgi:hypothetical protein